MRTFSIILSVLLTIHCNGQQPYTAPQFADSTAFQKMQAAFPIIEKIYHDYAKSNHFPSITYGVVANGKLVFSGSTGVSNLTTKAAASTKTVYRIASMSKSFTAMAILKLRDEGKLNLSDPVSKYIPEFQNVKPLTTDAPPITIQHLMTMSAGFPEDNPWGDQQLSATDQELLAFVRRGLSLSNVPGVNYEYSNLGFALLGRIITNVSYMPYQRYITDNILKPLGMNDSYYEYRDAPAAQLAIGYRWEEEQWKEEPLLPDGAYGAMGGMLCSLEDFAKYAAFHLNAWPPRNDADKGPVNRSSIREMHQPGRISNVFNVKTANGADCATASGYAYGLGWRRDCNGIVRIAHSGGLPGFGSEWRIYPDYGIGVISFSNRTYGAPSQANAIALDTILAIAGLKPRVLSAVPLLEATKEQLMKILPNWSAKETSEIFAENFFLDESLALRKAHTQQLFQEAGAIQKIGTVQAQNQLRGQFIIECTQKNIHVFFTMTPEAKPLVQQLDVWVEEKK
ncbi:MAG: serine hydrolase domain-containing protein [Saprospiraceae bacterium]|nr:serine hydrolase domain-containing protein [Saprospiraceae bacterium]